MLYNEERPLLFDKVVGQRHIVENLRNQSKNNNWFQVYIFCGQFGSGKTSFSGIISLASNCLNKDENGNPCLECSHCKAILNKTTTDIIEIDAASNTGVDNIRDLKESATYMPVDLKWKIYIIDEVHMLSKGAFNALLKLLENPPSHVIFILCTTELMAIPATVRSRASTYTCEQISFDDIFNRIKEVSEKRGFKVTDEALTLIAKNAQGAMRNAYGLLQQVTSGCDQLVEAKDVQKMLGITDVTYLFNLLKCIIKAKPADCILSVEKAVSMGKDLPLMVNDLLNIVVDAVVAISASIDKIHDTEHYKELLSEIVGMTCIEQLYQIADGLMDIRVSLRSCPTKTTVIVGIIKITSTSITKSLIRRLEVVEEALRSGKILDELREDITKDTVEQTELSQETPEDYPEDAPEDFNGVISEVYEETDMAAGVEEEPINQSEITENVLPVNEEREDQKEEFAGEITEATFTEDANTDDIVPSDKLVEPADNGVPESDDDEFDMFSILDDFNNISFDTDQKENSIPGHEENNCDIPSNESPSKQRRLEEQLRRVSEEDKIFTTALSGCIRTMQNGNLILKTPLMPAYQIVQTYLRVTDLKDTEVVFDPSVSLN